MKTQFWENMEHLRLLEKIADTAQEYRSHLNSISGPTDDWPLKISFSEADSGSIRKLRKLHEQLRLLLEKRAGCKFISCCQCDEPADYKVDEVWICRKCSGDTKPLEPRKSWREVGDILTAIHESNITGKPLVLTVTNRGVVALTP